MAVLDTTGMKHQREDPSKTEGTEVSTKRAPVKRAKANQTVALKLEA
jgi:hypothetical protein